MNARLQCVRLRQKWHRPNPKFWDTNVSKCQKFLETRPHFWTADEAPVSSG